MTARQDETPPEPERFPEAPRDEPAGVPWPDVRRVALDLGGARVMPVRGCP